LKIKSEFLFVIAQTCSNDASLHQRVSGVDNHALLVISNLISGSKKDELSVSEDHFLSSKSSSMHVMSVDLREIKSLFGTKLLLELHLLHSNLSLLSL